MQGVNRTFSRRFSFRPYLPSAPVAKQIQPLLYNFNVGESASSSTSSNNYGLNNYTKPRRKPSSLPHLNLSRGPALVRFGIEQATSVAHCREHARRIQTGKAYDVLNETYPIMFDKDIDYSIYTDDVRFEIRSTGHLGYVCDGMRAYRKIYSRLRKVGKLIEDREFTHSIKPTDGSYVAVHWRLQGLLFKVKVDISGISYYEFADSGKINRHSIEFLETNPPLEELRDMIKEHFRRKAGLLRPVVDYSC